MTANNKFMRQGGKRGEVDWMKVLHLNMVRRVGDVSLHMNEVML